MATKGFYMSPFRRILVSFNQNRFAQRLISLRKGLFSFFRRLRGGPGTQAGNVAEKPALIPPRPSRADIEKLVGMSVRTMSLYEQALRHRSALSDTVRESNERLEFLGDAVLDFVMAEHLYHRFPQGDEGFLTRLRSRIVNGQALAQCAAELGLGDMISMSDPMHRDGGRDSATILADALEAVIAALYLDLGEQAVCKFVQNKMLARLDLEDLANLKDNHKSLLLEHVQANGWSLPVYRVAREEGPPHDRVFTIDVFLRNQAYGRGRAQSKKKAEQKAAAQALDRLRRKSPMA